MTERTVPAWIAQLALGELSDEQVVALRGGGKRLGRRVELSVEHIAAVLGEDVAARVLAYEQRCRSFFDAWLAGEPAGPYVIVHRPLIRAKQVDRKDARVDLGGHLDALGSLSGVGELVEALTGSEPDWELVEQLGHPFEAVVTRDGNDTSIELSCTFDTVWPTELGGNPARGELRRIIRLRTSHAAWRDRRNRRLTAVEVDAEEIWPDPAQPS